MEFEEKLRALKKYSNPYIVLQNARNIYGDNVFISPSLRKNKKYMIWNPIDEVLVHFGEMGYEDYTYHKNSKRRKNYRLRASNIQGNWRDNKYSPNNLSLSLLW